MTALQLAATSSVAVRTRSFGLVSAAVLLLAGCAQYEPRPITPARTAVTLDLRTLHDPGLRSFLAHVVPNTAAGDRKQAWGLTELTFAALYYHPDIEIAQSKLAVAQAAIVTAGQIPNPSLRLTPTYHGVITVPSPWTVGPVIEFLIETFGRRGSRIAQAESLAAAALNDIDTASWQVRGRVRSALLKLWAAQSRLNLIQRRQNIQEQLVSILERGYSAGQISALDIARERTNLNQIRLTVAETVRQAAEARAELATAVGIPSHALERVNLSFAAFVRPAPIPGAVQSLRGHALRNRSDLQSLLASYEAFQSALQLEITKQFPNVTLGPGYTYDQGDNLYTLAVGADLPIFNQNQGPVAEAEARRQEAAARFKSLQAQIIGEIDRAFAVYRATTQALAKADALAADQRLRQQDVKRAFDAGEVDRTAMALADIELSAIELARLEAIIQQRQAIELLEDSLQRRLLDGHLALVPQRSL